MKKWTKPVTVTISAEKLGEIAVASACGLYNASCEVIRFLGE